jgi:hypothetical protein
MSRYQTALLFRQRDEIPAAQLQEVTSGASAVIEAFRRAGHLEGELRAKMSLADIMELAGLRDKAQEIALDVLPKAEAMEYSQLVYRANQHLSGQDFRNSLDCAFKAESEEKRNIRNSERSGEEVLRSAGQMLRDARLPEDRLPVVERECFRIRGLARERVSWCKHISMLEDPRHLRSQATIYRTDPSCVCQVHRYRSVSPDPDWNALILAFKRDFCDGCPDRDPIRTEP